MGNNKVVKDAVDGGYDINKTGSNLEPYSSKKPKYDVSGTPISQGTHASHPNYTQKVSELHDDFAKQFKGDQYKPDLWLDLFNKRLSKELDRVCGPGKLTKVDDVFNPVNGKFPIDPDELYQKVKIDYLKALKK